MAKRSEQSALGKKTGLLFGLTLGIDIFGIHVHHICFAPIQGALHKFWLPFCVRGTQVLSKQTCLIKSGSPINSNYGWFPNQSKLELPFIGHPRVKHLSVGMLQPAKQRGRVFGVTLRAALSGCGSRHELPVKVRSKCPSMFSNGWTTIITDPFKNPLALFLRQLRRSPKRVANLSATCFHWRSARLLKSLFVLVTVPSTAYGTRLGRVSPLPFYAKMALLARLRTHGRYGCFAKMGYPLTWLSGLLVFWLYGSTASHLMHDNRARERERHWVTCMFRCL